jgi:hypothetical protein
MCHSALYTAVLAHETLQGRDAVQDTAKSKRWLFDREAEMKQLDDLLQTAPRSMKVIVGPRNCGKTAILASWIELRPHVVYIDFRTIDSSTPAAFVAALLKQLLERAPEGVLPEVQQSLNVALSVASGLQATENIGGADLKFDFAKAISVGSQAADGTFSPKYMTAVFDALRYESNALPVFGVRAQCLILWILSMLCGNSTNACLHRRSHVRQHTAVHCSLQDRYALLMGTLHARNRTAGPPSK